MKVVIVYLLICSIVICVQSRSLLSFLETTQYDKTERPYIHEGKSANITLQLYIYTIGPINEVDFTFHLAFYMRQWWTDPRLIYNNSKLTEATSLDNVIWIPDTSLTDSHEIHTFPYGVRTTVNHQTGEVFISRRMRAVSKCEMNLKFYPMDHQICRVDFETFSSTTKNMELYWHSDPVITRDDIVLDGYKMVNVATETTETTYKVGNETQYFKQLIANIKVDRTYMYYVFRAYIPSILLLTFAFGTFWVPDSAVPARMAMIVTSFLSNTFILQGVTEKTVKVSYATPMQYFLVVTVVMIVLSLIEYLLILQLRRRSQEAAKSEERARSMVILANQTLVSSLCKENEKMVRSALKTKETEKKKTRKSETHIVDRISQIVFPLSYFIFCLAYFVYYLHDYK